QIITFLIAGHETTSGLLSFALYYLLKHREVLARAYEEVDRVLGADLSATPTYSQVTKLRYITQILNESLRLWPTAPAFALYPYEPTIIGGSYAVDKSHELMVLIPMLHRDRTVWGDDAEEFNPDHFSPEAEQHRPANAFKPFGNGQRACIGRQFAMQEATLVLGMLLQRFELIDHTDYQLKIKETLTLKPEDFRIKVRPRTARTVVVAPEVAAEAESSSVVALAPAVQHNTSLLVLYGSNLGTAEGIAYQIADDGKALGFTTTVAPLDDYVGRLPQDGAVVIVSASYNGAPPDNAAQFVRWLCDERLPADALRGVRYAVFGCGNRDWASTYQAIPAVIDDGLRVHGARPIYFRGEGDQRDDFDGQFRAWYGTLWPALAGALSIPLGSAEARPKGHRYDVEIVTAQSASPYSAEYNAQPLTVTASRELQRKDGFNPSPRSTRHIEVALPQAMTYTAGDHLGIVPRNDEALVRRVAGHFGFAPDFAIRIRHNASSRTPLPLDQPISVQALLASYVELQDVATRAQIQMLAHHTECPQEKAALLALAGDDEESVARYREKILAKHVSLIDLLETHRSCTLPFNVYLELLPPLRPRYYSISSSPLGDPQTTSITVGVVEGTARSGRGSYGGVCSTYLARLSPGDTVMGFVRNPNTHFRLPTDASTPLIMVAAGTGFAPFRGFLQERAIMQERGETVGPSLLFFGFRDPEQDYLYEEELSDYATRGITSVVPAVSRAEGQPKRYVQQAIREHANDVWNLLQQGAVIYVCGDASRMAPEVRAAFAAIYQQQTGLSGTEAEAWLTSLTGANRYLVDIWPSN
ncbi:MAG: bifunctional cytochrome P450/NADPH--P450 reductase, partial [Ktedonobacterales bacterium]